MNEVSCRVFSFFQAAEEAGWISLDELLVGSRLPLARLADPAQRVDWEDWILICERFADLVGSHRLRESGRFAMQPRFVGAVMSKIAPLLASPLLLYKTGMEWGGASLYRCVAFAVEAMPDGRIRIAAELAPGYRSSRAWFELLVGGIERLPTFVGQSAAVAEATHDGTSAVVFVTPPPQRGFLLWQRRLTAAITAPGNLASELTFQQRQLLETYHELSRRERDVFEMLARMPAGIALFHGGHIIYANASLSEIVGLPVSVLLQRPVGSLPVADDAELFRQTILEGTTSRTAIVRCGHSSGEVRTLRVSAIESINYQGAATRGLLAIDLTEETRAKDSLRHQEETLSAMSVATPDVIARVSREGLLLDIFGGEGRLDATAVLGLRGQSVARGPSLVPYFTQEHLESLLAGIRRTLDERRSLTIELGTTIAGQPTHYECNFSPILERDQVLIVARDITLRRQQERALAVSERMASLGTLAAGLGHEINNPLTFILDNQRALAEQFDQIAAGGPIDLAAMRALQCETLQGAERVRDIVRDLRGFSRVDGARADVLDLEAAIEEALRMVSHQIRHAATIVTEFGGVGNVRGDHGRVVQVFVNLFINAEQALRHGVQRDNRITVRTAREGSSVVATIEDNGRGIAAENVGRIFDPFFTTKPAGQGTGLGLAIVHRSMTEAGGSISVESEPGRGSTFKLIFAATPTTPTAATQRRAETPAPTSARRVLVIDDMPAVARAVARALRGHEVVVCEGGEEAIALLGRDQTFDAVICDLNMPGRDGIDVYEFARVANPALAGRFLFMTGGVFTERSRSFLEASRSAVLEKPARPDQVRRLVDAVIERAGRRGAES